MYMHHQHTHTLHRVARACRRSDSGLIRSRGRKTRGRRSKRRLGTLLILQRPTIRLTDWLTDCPSNQNGLVVRHPSQARLTCPQGAIRMSCSPAGGLVLAAVLPLHTHTHTHSHSHSHSHTHTHSHSHSHSHSHTHSHTHTHTHTHTHSHTHTHTYISQPRQPVSKHTPDGAINDRSALGDISRLPPPWTCTSSFHLNQHLR
ncbi:hypothetical protein LX36DRAFT_193377 [Colletotrichum falcatum]|nr:hypothetical protein LX36DRAFT_193377 [Colletotrichum falcatum]